MESVNNEACEAVDSVIAMRAKIHGVELAVAVDEGMKFNRKANKMPFANRESMLLDFTGWEIVCKELMGEKAYIESRRSKYPIACAELEKKLIAMEMESDE